MVIDLVPSFINPVVVKTVKYSPGLYGIMTWRFAMLTIVMAAK